MDFLHKSITGRARTRSEQATLSKENQKRKRELEDMRTARETALTNIKEKGLASRKQLELTQAKELAKPEAAYWEVKTRESEFTNYMDRAKAKKKGFALPGEERGGIAGSSESWKEEQPSSGTARITDEATGKVYEDLPEYSEVSAKSLLAGPTRSRASQVMTPPTDRAWRQDPIPKKRPRWQIPVEKTGESLYNVNDLIFGGVNRAGSKLYDWLTESVARP